MNYDYSHVIHKAYTLSIKVKTLLMLLKYEVCYLGVQSGDRLKTLDLLHINASI